MERGVFLESVGNRQPDEIWLNAFVGKSAPFYCDRWSRYHKKPFKGLNLPALFFPFAWMAYRKLYLEAAAAYAMVTAVPIAAAALFGSRALLIGDLLRVLTGVFANTLYYNKAAWATKKTAGMDEEQWLALLEKQGGVCPVAIFIVIVLDITLAVAA